MLIYFEFIRANPPNQLNPRSIFVIKVRLKIYGNRVFINSYRLNNDT